MSLLRPMERHGPRVLTPPAPSAGSSAPIPQPCKASSSPLGLSLHDTPGPAPALSALARPCVHGLCAGNYGGYRECHIQPDWLLIYQIDGDHLLLFLSRTGTHSDLF